MHEKLQDREQSVYWHLAKDSFAVLLRRLMRDGCYCSLRVYGLLSIRVEL